MDETQAIEVQGTEVQVLETCPYKEELDCLTTNFDGSIDREVEAQLKEQEAYAQFAAWDFCGYVWWNRGRKQWSCRVMVYREHVNTIHADTVEELREAVNDEYGGA